eukprot:7665976-Alexandrium_andersonii.AAC.1
MIHCWTTGACAWKGGEATRQVWEAGCRASPPGFLLRCIGWGYPRCAMEGRRASARSGSYARDLVPPGGGRKGDWLLMGSA